MSDPRRRSAIPTLLAYELRMLLRDTRTMLIAVVAPLVLFPALIWVMRAVEETEDRRLEETTYRWAATGSVEPWARALVEDALLLLPEDSGAAPPRFERVALEAGPGGPGGTGGDGEEAGTESGAGATPPGDRGAVDALLEERDLHVLVRGLTAAEHRALEAAEEEEEAAEEEVGEDVDVPVLRLEYRASSDLARRAATTMERRLERLRDQRRDSLFRARGLPVDPAALVPVEAENTASAAEEGGALLGIWLTPFLLLLMLTGGSIVAADAISGEKERGTLETLLTSAANRREIVWAKLLAVVVVGVAVAVVNTLNLLVYLGLGVLELPEELAVAVGPLDAGLVLLLLLPLTVLVAAALLLVSGYAKSYKEYQLYFLPLMLVALVPAAAAALPGMELRSVIALVPVSGVGVAVREVMVGERDWLFLLLAFLSSAAAAWGLARLAERTLSTEKLITGAELDEADLAGGAALFPRHVLRWFGVMWAAFFVVNLWVAGGLGIRGQIVVNLGVVFLGGSLLMIRRYGLPVRETLALRPVRWPVWVGVLIGAPAALVVGVGLAELVNLYVFPVPERMIEAFGESLVEDLPLWQLLLFLAVTPAIIEEIAFRGVLLHGLSRKLRPVALCLVVGAVFGIFHVSLFRVVPTAYLGTLLAAVVLLTGSVYPAMLWHGLNNATAIVPASLGWSGLEEGFTAPVYLAGVLGLGLSLWILWKWRTPYPGLRGMRPPAGRDSSPDRGR